MAWRLRDGKNHLGSIIRAAERAGPQVISDGGKARAVLLAADDYRRLSDRECGLMDFFQSSPWAKSDIDIARDKDAGRRP